VPFNPYSLVFLIIGMLLGWLLVRSFGKPERSASDASVKLVRTARTAEGREETRLVVNDNVILTASNDGVRLSAYADEVEQLEAVAARLARSLGVTVEFARIGPRLSGDENGVSIRSLPQDPLSLDESSADSSPPDEPEKRRTHLDRSASESSSGQS
jgi:hypothetical protein